MIVESLDGNVSNCLGCGKKTGELFVQPIGNICSTATMGSILGKNSPVWVCWEVNILSITLTCRDVHEIKNLAFWSFVGS